MNSAQSNQYGQCTYSHLGERKPKCCYPASNRISSTVDAPKEHKLLYVEQVLDCSGGRCIAKTYPTILLQPGRWQWLGAAPSTKDLALALTIQRQVFPVLW